MTINVLWRGGIYSGQIPVPARIFEVKLFISEVLHLPIRPDKQDLTWVVGVEDGATLYLVECHIG